MTKARQILTVTTSFLLLAAWAVPSRAESPTQVLRRTNDTLNRLLRQKTTAGSVKEKRVKSQIAKLVSSFLNFQELARRALSRHWEERTPTEQNEFVSLLKDLIERNYIKQLKSNLGYEVEYGKENVGGDSATVMTTVKVTKNRRTSEVGIEYRMKKEGGHWMVYDVITDEVSIVRNYRSQFNRIIKRESYDALVKKMKRKLQEAS